MSQVLGQLRFIPSPHLLWPHNAFHSPQFPKLSWQAMTPTAVGAAIPGWLQLKVIKTNNVAKVRNEAVAIVDFLSECGDQVITLPVFPSLITGGFRNFSVGISRIKKKI